MIEVDQVQTIAITDPHIIGLVLREQGRRGYGTATKTAGQLIQERCNDIDFAERLRAAQGQTVPPGPESSAA